MGPEHGTFAMPAAMEARPLVRRRRSGLRSLGAALAIATALGCGDPEPAGPGLLLVTVDSLRADFLACYGGLPGIGERMCALGREGARYEWAFSPSSSSAPAIASILTSTYPSTHAVSESAASFLSGAHLSLAEALGGAGFATAAFVSSPELNRSRNLQQGFEVYDDHTVQTAPGGLPHRSAEEITSAALAWLDEVRAPWFLWVHYREPHGPYLASPRASDEAASPGSGRRLRILPTPRGRGGIPSHQAIPGLFTLGAYEARYRAEIRVVDASLGRLLEAVDARDEPVGAVVTADHGEAFGENGYYLSHGHGVGLDQVRVPLFWRAPGPSRPEEIRVVVSTLDIMPTLLRSAGLPQPDALQGRVLPSAEDPPGAPEQARAVYALHPDEVAVASSSNFYLRLREPVTPDSNDLASFLRATAARTASLEVRPGAGLPPLEPARPTGITPLLEPRLAEFLSGASD